MFFFSSIDERTTNIELIVRMIILGLGLGSTMPIFTLAVQSAFSKQRLGEVTAGTQLFRSVGGTVGTAVLGGMMNSRLTVQMQSLQNEPFVAQMQQFNQVKHAGQLNGSIIQGVLNPDNQEHIRGMIAVSPSPSKDLVAVNFDHFINSSKIAFSDAIDSVFIVASCLLAVALIIVFFLPEVPLRKADRPAMEETGVMLEDELGQSDDESQPRLDKGPAALAPAQRRHPR